MRDKRKVASGTKDGQREMTGFCTLVKQEEGLKDKLFFLIQKSRGKTPIWSLKTIFG